MRGPILHHIDTSHIYHLIDIVGARSLEDDPFSRVVGDSSDGQLLLYADGVQ
jgi:hypothetical protein